jgi:hypothetical protein
MISLSLPGAPRRQPSLQRNFRAHAAGAAVLRAATSLLGTAGKRQAQPAGEGKACPGGYSAHRAALWQRGDALIAAACARGEALSVVMFDHVDLPELHALFGAAAARSVVSRFNEKVVQLAGSSGLPVRCGPTTWTLLLPHASGEAAIEKLRRAFGAGLAVESDRSELLLVPRIAVRTIGQEPVTMRQLHEGMAEEIQRANLRDLRRRSSDRRTAAAA